MRVKFSGHNFSSFWFCPGDSFKLQTQGGGKGRRKKKKKGRRGCFKNRSQNRWKQVYLLGKESLAPSWRRQIWRMGDREMVKKGAPSAQAPQNPHSSCIRCPFCFLRLLGHRKAQLRPLTLQSRPEGLLCPGRGGGQRGPGAGHLSTPVPQDPRELTKPPGTGSAGGRNWPGRT